MYGATGLVRRQSPGFHGRVPVEPSYVFATRLQPATGSSLGDEAAPGTASRSEATRLDERGAGS